MSGLTAVSNNIYAGWVYHVLCQTVTQSFKSFWQYDNQMLDEEKGLSGGLQGLILGEKVITSVTHVDGTFDAIHPQGEEGIKTG